MKKLSIVLCLAFIAARLFAQEIALRDVGVEFPQMKKFFGDMQRRVLDLPEVPGYTLLKADLHMHTVFSDGYVWPTTRVEEAFMEGIDAIAITDHLEFTPNANYLVNYNHNLPYDIAKKRADELGIILIRGAEITRGVPAGHFNAIFIEDANKLAGFVNSENPRDASNIKETLQEVKRQGGFVFWNHPWYQQPGNQAIWHPIHESLYNEGLIMGVEVNNRDRYYPIIFHWCMEKNLSMISTTDAHNPLFRLEPGAHRSMNIIMASEKTKKGIREALDNRQAVVYSQNYLYGKEEFLALIFNHSVSRKVIHTTDNGFIAELKNNSGIPYQIELTDTDGLEVQQENFIIDGKGNVALIFKSKQPLVKNKYTMSGKVINCHVAPEKPMIFSFELLF